MRGHWPICIVNLGNVRACPLGGKLVPSEIIGEVALCRYRCR